VTLRLVFGAGLRAQIEGEARVALPGECCGLIEGRRDDHGGVVAVAVHPARNIGGGDDRFEIDPADHIRILRTARARGAHIVGCYHSHPNGRAEPSARDLAGAAEVGFVWLIAAVEGARNSGGASGSDGIAGDTVGDGAAAGNATAGAGEAVSLAAFLFNGAHFVPVLLVETATLDPAQGLWV
jgi:proteasome lid subunit RPN8/RPN11